jgi:hypothetical protein
MIIFIDENLPPQLAEGLNILQHQLNVKNRTNHEVKSIKKEYGEGCKDEDWIPDAGLKGSVVITKDFRIQRIRHQRDLCSQYKLGLIFFNISKGGLTYWQIVENLITRWEEILKIIDEETPPFAYRFTVKSKKLELLD